MASQEHRWESGRLVGDHYRVDSFLDEGSAGEVYAAQNVWTGRKVALKRLHPEHREQSTIVERFLLEGRIGGRIEHPNIVQTLDMAREPSDDSFFIVQELLRGVGLRQLMEQPPRLHYREALDLIVPLLGALVVVHQHGIVHRDIKPENILVADCWLGHRIPKLLDFGIAKVGRERTLTQAGNLLGTLDYMAPEQVEARNDVDRRADVWAVGVLLYELLSGQSPFSAHSIAGTLTKILSHEPAHLGELVPAVPGAICAAVGRAMRKERQERHDSIQHFLEDLLRWSLTSTDESERALTSRHRISLPAMIEQKIQLGASSLAPVSLRASMMASSSRSSQFRLPESLRELAALMSGESGEYPDLAEQAAPAEQQLAEPDAGDVSQTGGTPQQADSGADALMVEAVGHLQEHAFAAAYAAADKALQEPETPPASRATLLMIQAEAAYWRGLYDRHELCIIEALALVLPGESVWLRCIGELADATNKLGAQDRLSDLVAELIQAPVKDETIVDHVEACCRLGIALQLAGWPEQVEVVLGQLTPEMYELAERHPRAEAWLCLLRSALADHAGDHAHSLALTQRAVSAFSRGGDARRACSYRVNIGSAAMLLGDYHGAERLLRESLQEAGQMRLAGAATMRLNLGITLARLGRLEEGQEFVTRALRAYISRGDWGGECTARVYLSEVLWMRGDTQGAEREALAAVERAHISPVLHAEALGMLSLVQQDRPMEAFMAASQAMALLQSVGGVAQGEARIRLAYALALDALGHRLPAAQAYEQGRDRLLERASRISDDGWRESFLAGVPEHARTLQLAESRGTVSA